MEALLQSIERNNNIGFINWGDIGTNSDLLFLKTRIEEKLRFNNEIIDRYHPNAYIASLLSMHSYEEIKKTKQGSVLNFKKSTSKILGGAGSSSVITPHQQKLIWEEDLQDWRIFKVYDYKEEAGYFAVVYINQKMGQLVLTHRGAEFEFLGLIKNESGMKIAIESVYGSKIGSSQAKAYEATLEIVSIAKASGYHLTFTGHSLGGWFAELSSYYCHYDMAAKFPGTRAIVFDSPGSGEMIENYRSNIESYLTSTSTDIHRYSNLFISS
jgi:hypothetical protein